MKQESHIECPHGDREDFVKHGPREHGTQRDRGNACRRSVHWEYPSRAWLPDGHQQIESQTLPGSGVSDIGRQRGISQDTGVATLKKQSRRRSTWPTQPP